MSLPNNDEIIYQEIQELKGLVLKMGERAPLPPEDRYFTVAETVAFLDCSDQHVYRLKGKILHYHRVGKLKFKYSDLVAFMEKGRREPLKRNAFEKTDIL